MEMWQTQMMLHIVLNSILFKRQNKMKVVGMLRSCGDIQNAVHQNCKKIKKLKKGRGCRWTSYFAGNTANDI
jgi:hypothetical protein